MEKQKERAVWKVHYFSCSRKCSSVLGKLDWLLWGDLTPEMKTEFGVFVFRMTLGL